MEIKKYQYNKNPELCDLFEIVFDRPMGKTESMRHFQWEYLDNPAGQAFVFVYETDKNQIISAYPSMPINMKIMNAKKNATLSFDSMTHPDFRGQRLFTKLGDVMYEYLGKKNICLTYGFPNSNIYKLRTKYLQWFNICDFPLMLRILNFHYFIKRYINSESFSKILSYPANWVNGLIYPIKSSRDNNIQIKQIHHFDERFDLLWSETRHMFPICVERNAAYLNWRYKKPEEDYEILSLEEKDKLLGYAVLKRENKFDLNIGYLVDLIIAPKIDANFFIQNIIQIFYKEKMDAVSVLAMKSSPYFDLFKKNGFIHVPKKLHPQDIYFGSRINTQDENEKEIMNPQNWFITWGDTDLV